MELTLKRLRRYAASAFLGAATATTSLAQTQPAEPNASTSTRALSESEIAKNKLFELYATNPQSAINAIPEIFNPENTAAYLPLMAYGTRDFYDKPDLLTEMLRHGWNTYPEEHMSTVAYSTTSRFNALKTPENIIKILATEGLAKASTADGIDVDFPHLYDLDGHSEQSELRNAITILKHHPGLSSAKHGTQHMLISFTMNALVYEDAEFAGEILETLADINPGISADFLPLYSEVLGANRTAHLVSDALQLAKAQNEVLSSFVSYTKYMDKNGHQYKEYVNSLVASDVAKDVRLKREHFDNPQLHIGLNKKNHQYAFGHALRKQYPEPLNSTLVEHIDFDFMSENVSARGLDGHDRIAVEASARGNDFAHHYLTYLLEEHPKRLLLQGDVVAYSFYKSEYPERGNEYIAAGLKALNYDPDQLMQITGKDLFELPFSFIHKTAGADTLAEDMQENPFKEFTQNIPGFGDHEPDSSLSGYVVTMEFSEDNQSGDKPHLLATANIMDRTLAAMGHTGISTIAIDAGRAGSEGYFKNREDFINDALVIQSSTATYIDNGGEKFRFANPDTVIVYSAGNKGTNTWHDIDRAEREQNSLWHQDPNLKLNIQDPTSFRHLASPHIVEFGATLYDPATGQSEIADYSNKDGQTLACIPGFSPGYQFHQPFYSPAFDSFGRGKFSVGTSFFSPMGAAYLAEGIALAQREHPDLKRHHIIYAMAQSTQPVTSVEYDDVELFAVATPHGLEFNHICGTGEFRRDQFLDTLERMQAAYDLSAAANPDTTDQLSQNVTREETQRFYFNEHSEETPENGQRFTLPISMDKLTTRPVFTLLFDNENYTKLSENEKRTQRMVGREQYIPVTITDPKGTSYDYVINLDASKYGQVSISGVGFMGAETKGEWTIETPISADKYPIRVVEADFFTVPKGDLIASPEFRKLHTLESIKGADLSHLSDIYVQDGGHNGKGGWISNAVENGWDSKLDLAGTLLEDNLRAKLPWSETLPSGFKTAAEQTQGAPLTSKRPQASPFRRETGAVKQSPRPPHRNPN